MGFFRTLLAISIVITHTTPIFGLYLVAPDDAIRAFFVISGFYMALILNEKYVNIQNPYKVFITNRLVRIFPTYYLLLIITFVFQGALLLFYFHKPYPNTGGLSAYFQNYESIDIPSLLAFIWLNLGIIGQDFMFYFEVCQNSLKLCLTDGTKYDFKLHGLMLVPQAWSIATELLFYLVAPFIVRRKVWLIATIVLFSFGLRMFFYFGLHFYPPVIQYFTFPLEIGYFLLGSLSYWLMKYLSGKKILENSLTSYFLISILFICVFFYRNIPPFGSDEGRMYAFLALTFFTIPFMFQKLKNNKIDRYIGELSFPIYLSHWFLINFTNLNFLPKIASVGVYTLVLSVIFSVLIHHYLVKPIETWRQARV